MSANLHIILATGNKDKVRELREIISDPDILVQSMKEAGVAAEPEENGLTFEENAMIKAQAVHEKVRAREGLRKTGVSSSCVPIIVMSDDSGLVIDALGGEPGIHSARFMGHDTSYTLKMNAILEKIKDVPDEKRTARFVCAAAAILPDGEILTTEGTMEGRIAHSIMGDNGFGYDPFFYLPEYGKTSAEITEEQKNAISHRGKAFRAMMAEIRKRYPQVG